MAGRWPSIKRIDYETVYHSLLLLMRHGRTSHVQSMKLLLGLHLKCIILKPYSFHRSPPAAFFATTSCDAKQWVHTGTGNEHALARRLRSTFSGPSELQLPCLHAGYLAARSTA